MYMSHVHKNIYPGRYFDILLYFMQPSLVQTYFIGFFCVCIYFFDGLYHTLRHVLHIFHRVYCVYILTMYMVHFQLSYRSGKDIPEVLKDCSIVAPDIISYASQSIFIMFL